jgi:beta-phosphoglucomutase
MNSMPLAAVIFDLDGVLTDTAEYHYLAWKRLADEEGLSFDRQHNEQLRGVSRRESLLRILGERVVSEEQMAAMMARKNGYYQEMLAQVSPADLLPGVTELLDELDAAAVPYAVASASRNAPEVVARLGLGVRPAVVAHGGSVARAKPAPDLFRYATARLGVPAHACLVVEDAAAGIEAAVAAGMPALALGPAERFKESGLLAHGRVSRRDALQAVTLADLRTMAGFDHTWMVVQEQFEPARQRHMETVFTGGNGYFATRGTFEEGFPGDLPLTLAHGIFDDVPVAFTELANLPNWLDCRISVDGHRFRLDQGDLLSFCRHVDLRSGILQRHVTWRAPHGVVLDLTFERFACYEQVHLAGLRLLVTAVNEPCQLVVHSGIDGHVANDDLLHWHHLDQGHGANRVWLHSRTRHSGLELATVAAVREPGGEALEAQACPGQPSLCLSRSLAPGETAQLDKLVAYTSSRDQAAEPEAVIRRAGRLLDGRHYDKLKGEQLAAWQRVWDEIDVVIEGDDEAQLAARFNVYQLQIAAARHDDRVSMGAKSLSGLGYRGHVFWDTEIFILPFFIYTQPAIARNMLLYRYHTLPGARRKAAENGYSGAQYAWESATTGDEVTPTWVPDFTGKGLVRIWTGDIELHITADVAYAVVQYWRVTGDDDFMCDYGAEMILDTARFWGERAELEEDANGRRYAIRDVIGPDEYHDHVDNNVFTNRMVQWHLETAVELLDWLRHHHPVKADELVEELDLSEERLAQWQDVAAHIIIHHDPDTGLMTQFDGFFERAEVDWPQYEDRQHSMQYLLGIEGANASQVIKQADVIMLLCLFPDHYDEKTWRTNWESYVPITDHAYGSSLGPAFHAWAACVLDKPDEAYEHFMRAARADLQDVRGNAGDGIHAASAGGLWQALAFGFAGLRLRDEKVTVRPSLPPHWQRLAFSIRHHGRRYRIDVRSGEEFDVSREL